MRRMGLFMGILLLLLAPLGCAGPEYWRGKELPDLEILEGSRRFESRTHSVMVDREAMELESILRVQSNCERVDGRMLLRPFFRIKLRQLAWAEAVSYTHLLRAYVNLIVDGMDREQLAAMEKAPLGLSLINI